MAIYWEKQTGGLCRLHSLNAYFGKKKLTDQDFDKYCEEYDHEMKKKYKQDISCKRFDVVPPDQSTVVSYILKKHNIASRFYPLGYDRKIQPDSDFIFVFNHDHIWGLRKTDQWHKVDSLSGIAKININGYLNNKKLGFIMPIKDPKIELKKMIVDIKTYVGLNINKKLKDLHQRKMLIGELEIYLGNISNLLEVLNIGADILQKYYEFNQKFIGDYLNSGVILEYVPWILEKIYTL